MLRRASLPVLLAVGLICPCSGLAQTTTPPDVVRLHDGSFLRGTIVESTPSQVVLMLATGEVRRLPADQVASVESAESNASDRSEAPAATAAPAPIPQPAPRTAAAPPDDEVHLHVRTAQDGLTLHRLTGSGEIRVNLPGGVGYGMLQQYSAVCVAPCDLPVSRGTHRFAVSIANGNPVPAGAPMYLRRDMTLDIGYDDRSGLRLAGWLTMAGGVLGGLALIVPSFFVDRSSDPYGGFEINYPLLVSGAAVEVAGVIVGMALAFLGDSARVDVVGPEGVRF